MINDQVNFFIFLHHQYQLIYPRFNCESYLCSLTFPLPRRLTSSRQKPCLWESSARFEWVTTTKGPPPGGSVRVSQSVVLRYRVVALLPSLSAGTFLVRRRISRRIRPSQFFLLKRSVVHKKLSVINPVVIEGSI